MHFYIKQKAAQITYLQNKLLFTFGILHISMGNFIDLGKSPFSKKVINIDQQRTLGYKCVNMKIKAQNIKDYQNEVPVKLSWCLSYFNK